MGVADPVPDPPTDPGTGGGVTPLAAGILLVFQCVLSAATCLFLWGLGGVLGGARASVARLWPPSQPPTETE